ncbi:hypothetical protein D3C86_1468710 [compost metagenome]
MFAIQSMLLMIFTTSPEPRAPQWKMFFPIDLINGITAATSSGSPPIMTVSVACSAPTIPPLTGASMRRAPEARKPALMVWSVSGKVVLIMQTTGWCPAGKASASPPGPSIASRI